jgi:BolA family transcriptional regulator, general stress-responsive regulator
MNNYKDLLIQALSPTYIELIDESQQHAGHAGARPGGNSHLKLIIASPLFEGKSLLQCHRMIYDTLGDAVGKEIHALSIQIQHA